MLTVKGWKILSLRKLTLGGLVAILVLGTVIAGYAQDDEKVYRADLIEMIVGKWQDTSPETSSTRWRQGIRTWLERLGTDDLAVALNSHSYDEIRNMLEGAAASAAPAGGLDTVQAVGKSFYPLDPCRLVDTRIAAEGFTGPIPGGAVRSYNATDSTTIQNQGGKAGGCGVPANAIALVVNFTSVEPGGKGHLRAYPYGTPLPLAAILNFSSSTIANATVLPICSPSCASHFSVYASNSTHLVVDVMGYFAD